MPMARATGRSASRTVPHTPGDISNSGLAHPAVANGLRSSAMRSRRRRTVDGVGADEAGAGLVVDAGCDPDTVLLGRLTGAPSRHDGCVDQAVRRMQPVPPDATATRLSAISLSWACWAFGDHYVDASSGSRCRSRAPARAGSDVVAKPGWRQPATLGCRHRQAGSASARAKDRRVRRRCEGRPSGRRIRAPPTSATSAQPRGSTRCPRPQSR